MGKPKLLIFPFLVCDSASCLPRCWVAASNCIRSARVALARSSWGWCSIRFQFQRVAAGVAFAPFGSGAACASVFDQSVKPDTWPFAPLISHLRYYRFACDTHQRLYFSVQSHQCLFSHISACSIVGGTPTSTAAPLCGTVD